MCDMAQIRTHDYEDDPNTQGSFLKHLWGWGGGVGVSFHSPI